MLLILISTQNFTLSNTLTLNSTVQSVRYSPDGKLLAYSLSG